MIGKLVKKGLKIKTLITAFFFVLIFLPALIPGVASIDNALFRLIQPLAPKTAANTQITLVTLPSAPTNSIKQQQQAMKTLAELLPNRTRAQQYGIMLPSSWQQALHWMEEGELLSTNYRANAIVASAQRRPYNPWLQVNASGSNTSLPRWIMVQNGVPQSSNHYLDADNLHWPLITNQGDQAAASFITQLWLSQQDQASFSWSPQHGLRHDNGQVQTDFARGVYAWSPKNRITRLSWQQYQEAPQSIAGIILFGEDNQQSQLTANALAALIDGRTAHTPWWGVAAQICAAFLSLLFVWVIGRFGSGIQWLASALLLLALIIGGWTTFLLAGAWVPAAPAAIIVVCAIALRTLVKLKPNAKPQQTSEQQTPAAVAEELQTLRLELARRQIDQGEPEQAKQNLMQCGTNPEVLEVFYDIAIGYERTRKLDQARETYEIILERQADFLDVNQRLARLPGGTQRPQVTADGTMIASNTLVIEPSLFTPQTLGRYEIEHEIGRGAMGTVYLATDPMIGRQVAIKTVDFSNLVDDERETFRQRFFREAEAAGRLSHPNIVTVYDVGEEHNLAYLAMDYVPGSPLSSYCKGESLLPIATVYRLLALVAEALAYAHEQGIVHRDIKPGNLMYNPESGQVKVADFGIARVTDGTRTRTGTIMGSPSYMSPEQMAGGEVDGRSDIFSLGASFYQLLSGNLPFKGENLAALAYQISKVKQDNVRDLRPDLPASATRIINKAMAKKPKDRYETAAEMADALKRGADRVRD